MNIWFGIAGGCLFGGGLVGLLNGEAAAGQLLAGIALAIAGYKQNTEQKDHAT